MTENYYRFSSVLLVDNNIKARNLLSGTLKTIGINDIKVADDGASAISIIAHDKPDLVIIEINVAPVSGMEVLGVIRTGKYGLPNHTLVIVCSEVSDKVTISCCIALGVNGYIIKPFTPEEILKSLRSLNTQTEFRKSDFYQGVLHGMAANAPVGISMAIMRAISPASDNHLHLRGEQKNESENEVDTDFLSWDDSFTVHHRIMDDQHKDIFQLINQAHKVMSGKQDGQLKDVIQQLSDHTLINFREEEDLMTRINYPQLFEHKRLHLRMYELTRKMIPKIETLESTEKAAVLRFLRDWWVKHVSHVDKDYGELLLTNK